ncbi:MAG TPA: CAP domain-containing protein [Steroidobacteraceae bacterium]
MNGRHPHAEVLSTLLLGALLTACGGGGSGSSSSGSGSNGGGTAASTSYTVGGSVSGLNGVASVSLNGATAQSLSSDGSFVFSSSLASGDSYIVTVVTAPTGETCSVSNGSGTVGSANVTNVTINCAVPSGTSVPPNTYSAASFQSGYFARINAVRQALQLGLLAQSSDLDASSQAQALYNAVNFNPATMFGVDPSTGDLYAHSEDSGMPDFYAATPQARATLAGYSLGGVGEVAGGTLVDDANSGLLAANQLLNTVYHRANILLDTYRYIGIGVDAASNSFEGYGWYVSDMGTVNNAQTLSTGTIVTYPADGATDAFAYFCNSCEDPSPIPSLPSNQALGGPISAQIAAGHALSVTSFTLADAGGSPVSVHLSDAQTDTSGFLPGNIAFITPEAPLSPGGTYTATFSGSDGSTALSKTWSFTTLDTITVLTASPYVVHNGSSLAIDALVPSGVAYFSLSTSLTSGQYSASALGASWVISVPSGAVTSAQTIQLNISDAALSVSPATITITVEP